MLILRRLVILLKKNYYDVHICEKIALNQDYISALILDVMEIEPLQTLSLLWKYPWVVVSLHVSDTCKQYSGPFLAAE